MSQHRALPSTNGELSCKAQAKEGLSGPIYWAGLQGLVAFLSRWGQESMPWLPLVATGHHYRVQLHCGPNTGVSESESQPAPWS